MKDSFGGKIMTKITGLRGKIYSCLIDDSSKDKKAKDTQKYVIERKLKSENSKNYLEATLLESKIKQLEKINIDNLQKIIKNL